VAGITDFFTNREAVKEEKVDIEAPAFSLTKVQAGLGALIAAVSAVVPTALQENQTVVVAAIAAGTVVMLGVFALAATDLITRQRAAEAKLRWPGGSGGEPATTAKPDSQLLLLPDREGLVLQGKHSGVEYEVVCALAEGNMVTLVARADGQQPLEPTFKPRA
jgi:hypothetical protein